MEVQLDKDLENSAGVVFGRLTVTVKDDGSTPQPLVLHNPEPIGYTDQGLAIERETDYDVIEAETQKLMAVAIPIAKQLAEGNGIDPSIVNFRDMEAGDVTNG